MAAFQMEFTSDELFAIMIGLERRVENLRGRMGRLPNDPYAEQRLVWLKDAESALEKVNAKLLGRDG